MPVRHVLVERSALEAMRDELIDLRRDKARMDFIEAQTNGDPWIARPSTSGRGYRLHNSSHHGGSETAREAIDKAMEAG